MDKVKLSIVIHTEEEFDWSGGFNRQNDNVTHGAELTRLCEHILLNGQCITFAMDWAFVNSTEGVRLIRSMQDKHADKVEFATHLHPWVNPPYDEQADQHSEHAKNIEEFLSYPGNLPAPVEKEKLKCLTDKIHAITGKRPTTYLAGRYGVGDNTYKILKQLGYETDVSISPFADFSHQDGPDFSSYNNQPIIIDGIECIPHSTGYISYFNKLSDWLNTDPSHLPKLNNNPIGKALLRVFGVKKVRLSPEGFDTSQMLTLAKSLTRIGVKHLIYSFHSSSSKTGGSPYSSDVASNSEFIAQTLASLKALSKVSYPTTLEPKACATDKKLGR